MCRMPNVSPNKQKPKNIEEKRQIRQRSTFSHSHSCVEFYANENRWHFINDSKTKSSGTLTSRLVCCFGAWCLAIDTWDAFDVLTVWNVKTATQSYRFSHFSYNLWLHEYVSSMHWPIFEFVEPFLVAVVIVVVDDGKAHTNRFSFRRLSSDVDTNRDSFSFIRKDGSGTDYLDW